MATHTQPKQITDNVENLLRELVKTGQSIVLKLESINIYTQQNVMLGRILLSLHKDELLEQKIGVFLGKVEPKKRLMGLYLTIGNGKTRSELMQAGYPEGTVLAYCHELLNENLIHITKVCPDGQEVLGYTVIEELTQLSQNLKKLLAGVTKSEGGD
jgi:hypothetical protein